jgi:hypothetical protein
VRDVGGVMTDNQHSHGVVVVTDQIGSHTQWVTESRYHPKVGNVPVI